ncbi:MAG: Bax inhibitor-1/YccA family protein [Candidatus Omnitrophica bacterium]|nr:Bax inhibitor-1/YccA family protein [Candidatus Omnitrophota bacterium]
MRSGNPVLNDNAFKNVATYDTGNAMTVQGTTNKAFLLLALILLSASWVWSDPVRLMPFLIPAVIVGFIIALVTVFNKKWAMFTSPIYALIQGVILGGISAMFERSYPGIVMQAVGLTFGTMFALLLAYKTGFIAVTDNFRMGIFAATGGIAIFYLVSLVLGFFNINIPLINSSGPWGIAFSLFVVVIAALNLVLDFDFIEKGAQSGAPKYMEWYGAFGLMVTLIWLYIEILRLLSKLRSRN